MGIFFALEALNNQKIRGAKMNVDYITKTNPFSVSGTQTPRSSDAEIKKTCETEQTASVQTKAPSQTNFVQKIKDTNDAVGFIQTGQAFLARLDKEGVSDFGGADEVAKNFSFSQKPISSKQSFDTTAGIIHIDLMSEELGYGGDYESWKKETSEMLKSKKAQISSPLAAFGAAKKEQMNDAMQKMSTSNQNPKLDSLFGNINENLSRMRQIVG